jgi:fructose-1,6-bisphosphatase/inositol monophosphatase family enzyme
MMFTTRHAVLLAELMRAAARTEIMPRFRRLDPDAVREKSSKQDLVTDADEAAERFIADGLTHMFPGCLVVGEEAASRDPALIGKLAGAGLAFVVDPIDGTANYAAGLPLFGVMVAAVVRGETVAGVILDPVSDSFSVGVRGEGAWEEQGGVRTDLRVAAPVGLGEMTGAASWRFLPTALRDRVLAGLPRVAATWDHRCAAHEYRALISGHAHFVLFNRLMPWDHLAGVLLHREAGGFSAKFDGSAYLPGETEGGLICAPDRAGWDLLQDSLLGR